MPKPTPAQNERGYQHSPVRNTSNESKDKRNNRTKGKFPASTPMYPYSGTTPNTYNNHYDYGYPNRFNRQRVNSPRPWGTPMRGPRPVAFQHQPGPDYNNYTHYPIQEKDFGSNIPTRNRFFPLSDTEAPGFYDQQSQGYIYNEAERNGGTYYPARHGGDYDQPRPNPAPRSQRVQGNPDLGFPRTNQGQKRPGERKEESEGGGGPNKPKRRRP